MISGSCYGGRIFVTARLSAAVSVPVTVDVGYTGSATRGVDYQQPATRLVIAAGSLFASVPIQGIQDTLDEANELVVVDILTVTNGSESGVQRVQATLVDDDAPPTVSIAASSTSISEAVGTSTITVSLSTPSALPVTVNLGFTGTALNNTDYTRSASQVVIPAGATSRSITLQAVQDILPEGNETILLDVLGIVNGTELGVQQTTVTIIDDDPAAGPGDGEGAGESLDGVYGPIASPTSRHQAISLAAYLADQAFDDLGDTLGLGDQGLSEGVYEEITNAFTTRKRKV